MCCYVYGTFLTKFQPACSYVGFYCTKNTEIPIYGEYGIRIPDTENMELNSHTQVGKFKEAANFDLG